MSALRHLSWENFRTTVLISGQQRVHRVSADPLIELFSDGSLNRIGIVLAAATDAVVPPELSRLHFISARTISRGTQTLLEVATSATALQRQFYHFAVAVAERVLVERLQAVDAVKLELDCFIDLLEETRLLGIEQQLGLLGELHFLEYLVLRIGVREALDAWLSPLKEPHDFRIQCREFEIKTTVSPRRIHTIHGMEQLIPSSGCSLYLISVVFGPPGTASGFSLTDKVTDLSRQFAATPVLEARFMEAVEARDFHLTDGPQYTRRFIPRRPMGLIAVEKDFPAVTRPLIQRMLGPDLANRIESLQYEANVEGLEVDEGSAGFDVSALGIDRK